MLPADPEAVDGDIVVVDAGTRPTTLGSLLASAEAGHAALVVIATSADVESRALQVLLPEKQIVLKPVHATALHEAFASALGVRGARRLHEAPRTRGEADPCRPTCCSSRTRP